MTYVLVIAVMMMAGIGFIEADTSNGNKPTVSYDDKECVFPFYYKKEWYHGCITKDKGEGGWCSKEEYYKDGVDGSWKWCDIEERPKTSTFSDDRCKFPFTYKGDLYYGCISLDHPRHKSWCFTKDEEGNQTNIQDLCKVERNLVIYTFGGSTSYGWPCMFPFTYKDVIYYGCTNDGDDYGRYWCAITSNVDSNGHPRVWGYCNIIDTWPHTADQIRYSGKAWESSNCVFQSIFKGTKVYGCIGSGMNVWCPTTDNYDRDGLYKWCDGKDFLATSDFIRLQDTASRSKSQCSWPSVENGRLVDQKVFLRKTLHDGYTYGEFHCFATSNYDRDQQTLISEGGKKPKDSCAFPFKYENTIYHSCASGKTYYWCSSTLVYKDDWQYCEKGRNRHV